MKKSAVLVLALSLLCCNLFAQGYTSYFTGDVTDVTTNHQTGVCLMGGATENDDAMRWFLTRADGGDILVLRASGSDGYNDYFYTELGLTINSVETIVINNAEGALSPYVLTQIENAEAIWFAGGDQYNYVSYFKGTATQAVLNNFINIKQATIGGTSAGMAILGGHYFDAENGTVTSQQALTNPYNNRVSIGHSDFLEVPGLENIITDTHFNNPDRRGRHLAFLARIATDTGIKPFGIVCEEYVSVCIDENNKAIVFGDAPGFFEYAYFTQPNCGVGYEPEICEPNTPLTWEQNNDAVRAFKVRGTNDGVPAMDLNNWETVPGAGIWEHWTASTGNFDSNAGEDPMCFLLNVNEILEPSISITPNPFSETFQLHNAEGAQLHLFDITGKLIPLNEVNLNMYDGSQLPAGIYFVHLTNGVRKEVVKLIKK